MKKILIIPAAFFLISCGSSSVNQVKSRDAKFPELSGVTNGDFKPKKLVRYNQEADYHIIGDLVNDALKDESLDKVDLEKIEEVRSQIVGVMGLCYLNKTNEGLKILDKLYPKYKNNPSYWNQIASCYFKQGKMRKAKIFYNKSLTIDHAYVPAINNMGVIYLKEGKDQKALAAFKQVLKYKKRNKTAKYNMANLYIKYGLFEKAQGLLLNISQTYSKDRDVILSLTYIQIYQNKINKALTYLKSVGADELRRPEFSIALYYIYKLSKNKKSIEIEKYLERLKLSNKKQAAFESIKRL